MAQIVGKWKLTSSTNFIDLLKACGAPEDKLEKCKVFEKTGDNTITEEFYLEGQKIGRRIYKADGSLHSDKSVTIGEEADGVSVDERPIKLKVTVSGDNKVIREEKGANYAVTITNEINGNELIQTLVGAGVTSVRKLHRV